MQNGTSWCSYRQVGSSTSLQRVASTRTTTNNCFSSSALTSRYIYIESIHIDQGGWQRPIPMLSS